MSGAKWATALVALLLSQAVQAFIPAQPVNDTALLSSGSSDFVQIAWQPQGMFRTSVSRQLSADTLYVDGNNGSQPILADPIKRGVLVHFSELVSRTEAPASVPWIAMVNCDANETDSSMVDDIFTLARDHGAAAALLYSLTSEGCLMNSWYRGPDFQKVLDVYATTSKQGARLIESQFSNVLPNAYSFDSDLLNNSATAISALLNQGALASIQAITTTTPSLAYTSTLRSGDPLVPDWANGWQSATGVTNPYATTTSSTRLRARQATSSSSSATRTSSGAASSATPTQTMASYLAAVMASANNTVTVSNGGGNNNGFGNNGGGGGGNNTNTGLAMIILYAITGVVTFMFFIVILSGAIRAIRHPERYGPRAGLLGRNGQAARPAQTRAHGLTRAILDTFPVIKFGGKDDDDRDGASSTGGKKVDDVELGEVVHPANSETREVKKEGTGKEEKKEGDDEVAGRKSDVSAASFHTVGEESTLGAAATTSGEGVQDKDVAAAAVPAPTTIDPTEVDDTKMCPICVCDFESGEDVRILPCDARHRFHRDCIDPWLLQVSSLCPLCRLDLSRSKDGDEPAARPSTIESAQAIETERDEIQEEAFIISNLRAMLPGGRRERGNLSAAAAGTEGGAAAGEAGASGSGFQSNRFFRYVATRRRQRAASAAAAAENAPTPSRRDRARSIGILSNAP